MISRSLLGPSAYWVPAWIRVILLIIIIAGFALIIYKAWIDNET